MSTESLIDSQDTLLNSSLECNPDTSREIGAKRKSLTKNPIKDTTDTSKSEEELDVMQLHSPKSKSTPIAAKVLDVPTRNTNSQEIQSSIIVIRDSSSSVNSQSTASPTISQAERILTDLKTKYDTLKPVTSKKEKTPPPILNESTQSLPSLLSPIRKKITILVEISTVLHINKEQWTGEIEKVVCSNLTDTFRSESGYSGDISKSLSPTSSMGSTKPNRISVVSSGSSSSLASSASAFARAFISNKLTNGSKQDDVKVTDERMNELKKKWKNMEELNKIPDFLDHQAFCVAFETKPNVVVEEQTKEPLETLEEVLSPILSTNKTKPTRNKRLAKLKSTPSVNPDAEIPKKRQRRAGSVDNPTTVAFSKIFSVGDNVFGKWTNRKFYAAVLDSMTTDGKWNVKFFDGDEKVLSEEFLIKAEEFTMVGHNVYASQGDDKFTPGIITGCELKHNVLQYIVAQDEGDISVPSQFLYLTENQARQIRTKSLSSFGIRTPTKLANSSPAHKRSTRSKTKLMMDAQPSGSGLQRTIIFDSDDDVSDDIINVRFDYVTGVEPESYGGYENGIKGKGKSVAGKRFVSGRTKANDADASILGPLPPEGSVLFKNIHILMTCTRQFESNAESSSEMSSSENFCFSKVPFVKDRLKLQLEIGGAIVYNNFDDIPPEQRPNTYLISNRPNTTAKYILCIAAGIRCVCHEWVVRCCTQNELVPVQDLPIGWSIERESFIDSSHRKTYINHMNLLIKENSDKNFYKFWTKVSHLCGIPVSKLTIDSNFENITAILFESGCRDESIDRALAHNVPLVTTFWLIQSLIEGEPLNFDMNKSFLADYTDSD